MTTDLLHAFGHPHLRAGATAPDRLADRISLRDHIAEIEIGAFQQERGTTQRIRFNLVVEVARHDTGADDDVDKILSYDTLTEAIAHELTAERLNLLETLAERVALRVLAAPQALRCFVRIEKLDRGPGALGVEIVRDRDDLPGAVADDAPQPHVVFLSNGALKSPLLGGWIDQLVAGSPAILCVDLPETAPPVSDNSMAQRRIDLLAMDQNAWVLAGQDRRCVVVGSRTEIDWALKHDVLTVWAPSKIVLDSVEPPSEGKRSGPALALWFAEQVGATSLLCIGGDGPGEPTLPDATVSVTLRPVDAAQLLDD